MTAGLESPKLIPSPDASQRARPVATTAGPVTTTLETVTPAQLITAVPAEQHDHNLWHWGLVLLTISACLGGLMAFVGKMIDG
jgi:hypothetical protein